MNYQLEEKNNKRKREILDSFLSKSSLILALGFLIYGMYISEVFKTSVINLTAVTFLLIVGNIIAIFPIFLTYKILKCLIIKTLNLRNRS